MKNLARMAQKGSLVWLQEAGVGMLMPEPSQWVPYDGGYFDEYRRRADTEVGRQLMGARERFVRAHWDGQCIDIGIGSGAFIERMNADLYEPPHAPSGHRLPRCYGDDVNPVAVRWLEERGLYVDAAFHAILPHGRPPAHFAITLWDVIEHVPAPWELLDVGYGMIFVTTPIYTGAEQCMASKHYKPGEHIWYWTRDGLVRWFGGFGYQLVEESDFEVQLGRESIGAYAFRLTA